MKNQSNNYITMISILMVYAAAAMLTSTSNGPVECRAATIVIMIVAATVVLIKKIRDIKKQKINNTTNKTLD